MSILCKSEVYQNSLLSTSLSRYDMAACTHTFCYFHKQNHTEKRWPTKGCTPSATVLLSPSLIEMPVRCMEGRANWGERKSV
ncbi:unnamed protein product [Pleuronectes platessa]|uniref:Uncharacterized protein n=1 Tax=Pleuronectes platessa TaxID=8262 RepID=A0A9N7U3T3_PLEPL|nr:unnamed protein product [Pleuronectes platessa]